MVHLIVTVLAAAGAAFSAYALLTRAAWVVGPLESYGVAASWWPWLGAAKAAGAAGLREGPRAGEQGLPGWRSTGRGGAGPAEVLELLLTVFLEHMSTSPPGVQAARRARGGRDPEEGTAW
ncbi:DoxX family protein [Streptosporangium sp. NPDC002721]|uniref:DoxX family protein n=1 Tax=Streptosporangium sp. NPDC002721 TaxID=3366188 RepID=UPI0036920781